MENEGGFLSAGLHVRRKKLPGLHGCTIQPCFLFKEPLQQVRSNRKDEILCLQQTKWKVLSIPWHHLPHHSPAQFGEDHLNIYARGFSASRAKLHWILETQKKVLATYTKDLPGKQTGRGCSNAGSWHPQPFTICWLQNKWGLMKEYMLPCV